MGKCDVGFGESEIGSGQMVVRGSNLYVFFESHGQKSKGPNLFKNLSGVLHLLWGLVKRQNIEVMSKSWDGLGAICSGRIVG